MKKCKIFMDERYAEPCVGVKMLTPNCQRGLTVWLLDLVFCCAWDRDVGRGFDLSWRGRELLRWDF